MRGHTPFCSLGKDYDDTLDKVVDDNVKLT